MRVQLPVFVVHTDRYGVEPQAFLTRNDAQALIDNDLRPLAPYRNLPYEAFHIQQLWITTTLETVVAKAVTP